MLTLIPTARLCLHFETESSQTAFSWQCKEQQTSTDDITHILSSNES